MYTSLPGFVSLPVSRAPVWNTTAQPPEVLSDTCGSRAVVGHADGMAAGAEHDAAALLPGDRGAVAGVRGLAARAEQVRLAWPSPGDEHMPPASKATWPQLPSIEGLPARAADAARDQVVRPSLEVADEHVRDGIAIARRQVGGRGLERDAARLAGASSRRAKGWTSRPLPWRLAEETLARRGGPTGGRACSGAARHGRADGSRRRRRCGRWCRRRRGWRPRSRTRRSAPCGRHRRSWRGPRGRWRPHREGRPRSGSAACRRCRAEAAAGLPGNATQHPTATRDGIRGTLSDVAIQFGGLNPRYPNWTNVGGLRYGSEVFRYLCRGPQPPGGGSQLLGGAAAAAGGVAPGLAIGIHDRARCGDEPGRRVGAKAGPSSSTEPPCAPTPGSRKIAARHQLAQAPEHLGPGGAGDGADVGQAAARHAVRRPARLTIAARRSCSGSVGRRKVLDVGGARVGGADEAEDGTRPAARAASTRARASRGRAAG